MWIKTDYDFGYPYKTFTVSVREVALANEIKNQLMNWKDSPSALEKVIQSFIEFYRPSLKGCSVCGIIMRGGMTFEISVTHPSLPRMMMAQGPEIEPLIPGDERRMGYVKLEDEVMVDPGEATINCDFMHTRKES